MSMLREATSRFILAVSPDVYGIASGLRLTADDTYKSLMMASQSLNDAGMLAAGRRLEAFIARNKFRDAKNGRLEKQIDFINWQMFLKTGVLKYGFSHLDKGGASLES